MVDVLIFQWLASRKPDVDIPFGVGRGIIARVARENKQVWVVGCTAKQSGVTHEVDVLTKCCGGVHFEEDFGSA